jgi:integrase
MRIAKMPHVRFDKSKKRYLIEKRVPHDIREIIGGSPFRYHKFPQHVGREEANALSVEIVQGWESEWDALRPRPRVLVQPPRWVQLPHMAADLSARVREMIAREFPEIGRLSERGGFRPPVLVEAPADGSQPDYPGQPAIKLAEASEVFTSQAAFDLWVEDRRVTYHKKTGERPSDAMKSKLARLVAFLGADDLGKVVEADLRRYIANDLMGPESEIKGPGGQRDHILMLKRIFRLADERGRIPANPAARLTYEKHSEEYARDPFTPEQNAIIMRAAMAHDNPVIRISTLICGFSGLRPHEFVEASTADFEVRDGALTLWVRKDNRQGDERSLKTAKSKRFIVIHSAARPVIERYLAERRAALGGEGALFGLPKYGGRSATAATNKLGLWLRKIPGLAVEEKQSFYSFRHTVCTEFERHPDKVSDALGCFITGHADGKSTVKRRVYLHPTVEDVRKAIELLPNPFEPAFREAA